MQAMNRMLSRHLPHEPAPFAIVSIRVKGEDAGARRKRQLAEVHLIVRCVLVHSHAAAARFMAAPLVATAPR